MALRRSSTVLFSRSAAVSVNGGALLAFAARLVAVSSMTRSLHRSAAASCAGNDAFEQFLEGRFEVRFVMDEQRVLPRTGMQRSSLETTRVAAE